MKLPTSAATQGLLSGLPVATLGAMARAPWWGVGVLFLAGSLAVPLTGLALDHIRRRRGDVLEETLTTALREISDPEKRIQAIIAYRQVVRPPSAAADDPPGPMETGDPAPWAD